MKIPTHELQAVMDDLLGNYSAEELLALADRCEQESWINFEFAPLGNTRISSLRADSQSGSEKTFDRSPAMATLPSTGLLGADYEDLALAA